MTLDNYYTLERLGLRVRRLALRAMNFSPDWGWGADEDTVRYLFNTHADIEENFIYGKPWQVKAAQ